MPWEGGVSCGAEGAGCCCAMEWMVRRSIGPLFEEAFEGFDRDSFSLNFLKGGATLQHVELRRGYLRKALAAFAPERGKLAGALANFADGARAVCTRVEVKAHGRSVLNVTSHPMLVEVDEIRVSLTDAKPAYPSFAITSQPRFAKQSANARCHDWQRVL